MVVLKRIHIKNFRSISDATIDLDDFNFLWERMTLENQMC